MITSAEKSFKTCFWFSTSINVIILWIFPPQIVPQLSVSGSWRHIHTFKIREEGKVVQGTPLPTVHLRTNDVTWTYCTYVKGNHLEVLIQFKFFKTVLISRLFEQISRLYEQIFAKWLPKWLRSGCPKKFKLLKYEHVIYHFKARDLEIPLI